MKTVLWSLTLSASLTSVELAFAQDCPDLSGVYEVRDHCPDLRTLLGSVPDDYQSVTIPVPSMNSYGGRLYADGESLKRLEIRQLNCGEIEFHGEFYYSSENYHFTMRTDDYGKGSTLAWGYREFKWSGNSLRVKHVKDSRVDHGLLINRIVKHRISGS